MPEPNAKPNLAPIFIVGVHRSGTTLLRYMLSSSPRIYIPPESDFIPRFFLRRARRNLQERQVDRMLTTIFERYRFVKEWQGERPGSGLFFAQMLKHQAGPTPAAFLDLLFRKYARQHGAERWGDKTPIYASYIDLIHDIFPKAQFIHIIRDGRDVALSMLDKWGKNEIHVDLYFTARNYMRRITDVQASAVRLGSGLFLELRYERLVQNPLEEMRKLCEFLAEPFVPEMVRPHELARERIAADSFHDPVRRPLSIARIGRWRSEMSAVDQRLFHHVAGDKLAELGYDVPEYELLEKSERARLIALRVKYELLQAGRRAAQALGIAPPI